MCTNLCIVIIIYKYYLGIENAYYKVGRLAGMTSFSRFLWNASTDFKICFIKKNFHTNKTQTGRVVTFGKMTSSHQKKTTLFFLSVRRGQFKVLPVDQLAQSGVQNIGFVHTSKRFFIFLNSDLKWGNLKKKRKKTFFGRAKTGKHGYFCCTPTGLPDDFSGFYYFFPDRRHVSDVPFLTDKLCSS